KGPISQKLVYGNCFSKPSLDIDLLVSPSEYDTASRVIKNNGFNLIEECASLWWKYFLGEQHFLSSDHLPLTIDLHYRTHQPGRPFHEKRRCSSLIPQLLISAAFMFALCLELILAYYRA